MKNKMSAVLYALVCIVNPFFWYLSLNLGKIIDAWSNIPTFIINKTDSIFALYNLRYILELRLYENFLSRFLFNKFTLLVNDMSEILSLISLKTYFIDNKVFNKFELIHFFFIPIWFIGFYALFKNRKLWPFIALFITGFIVYISDQKNLNFFVLPSFVHAYIIYYGFRFLYEKK